MPATDNELLALADKLRNDLLRMDAATLARLTNAYSQIHSRAVKDLTELVNAILAKQGGDPLYKPSKGQVQRMAQYKQLIDGIEKEVDIFDKFLKTEVRMEARQLIAKASQDAKMLIARAYGDNAEITAAIQMLNPQFTESLLGFLDPDGKLWTYWDTHGSKAAADVAKVIMENIGLGRNPLAWAKDLTRAMGATLTSGLRTARTIQLWSYREGTRANYIANQDIVTGWQWYANLDGITCPACIALHGKVFENKDALEGHWQCRCTMLPVTILNPTGGDVPPGEEWFKGRSEAEQRKILGPGKYEAWKGGAFKFGELADHTDDVAFGKMYTETPLYKLIGAEPPNYTKS